MYKFKVWTSIYNSKIFINVSDVVHKIQHKTLHIETLNKLSNTYPMKLKIINYLLSETWLTDLDRSRSPDGSHSNVED